MISDFYEEIEEDYKSEHSESEEEEDEQEEEEEEDLLEDDEEYGEVLDCTVDSDEESEEEPEIIVGAKRKRAEPSRYQNEVWLKGSGCFKRNGYDWTDMEFNGHKPAGLSEMIDFLDE